MLHFYFSLRQFLVKSSFFSYIVLRLTYIRGLILEMSRSFPIVWDQCLLVTHNQLFLLSCRGLNLCALGKKTEELLQTVGPS